MEINIKSTISKNQEILTTEIENELGLLNISSGVYYSLNATGKVIWDLLNDPVPVNSLISQIRNNYDVDEETCREDVFEILNHMYKNRLIRVG